MTYYMKRKLHNKIITLQICHGLKSLSRIKSKRCDIYHYYKSYVVEDTDKSLLTNHKVVKRDK
jgi:hypothetical protein